jgi:hypothetical protein
MSRAIRLLAAYENAETKLMNFVNTLELTPETIETVLVETLRVELTRILAEQDHGAALPDAEIDGRISALEARQTSLRRAARSKDFSQIEDQVLAAANAVRVVLEAPLPPELGHRATDLVRDLLALEVEVLDGRDARSEASALVARFSAASVDNFVAAPVLLSAAFARTREMYPTKAMKGNIDAIAQLVLAFFGDIPVSLITEARQEEFFAWMARLPKSHGKSHGKNRFCRDAPKDPSKCAFTKQDEIDEADAADEEVMEAIRARNDLSNAEKRALLAEQLVPRLTMTTIRRNRRTVVCPFFMRPRAFPARHVWRKYHRRGAAIPSGFA